MGKLIFIPLMLLVACTPTNNQIETASTNNRNFKVDFLFEYDGCKVYRFEDYRTHYFTNCTQTLSSWQEMCGKGCTKTIHETIGGRK